MYRHCKCQKCNQCNSNNDDMIEDICDDVNYCDCDMNDCECGFDDECGAFPANYMYGQSYVPIQKMNKTFTPEVGLRMGTIQKMKKIYLRNTNMIGEGCNNAQ